MRQPSEQFVCPRNGSTQADVAALGGDQIEKASEDLWDAEQVDRHLTSRGDTGIACQPFGPGQPPMRPLLTRQRWRRGRWAESAIRCHLDLHLLSTQQVNAGAPLFAAAPVAPEQRSRGNGQRVQEQADPAWMFGRRSMPLTVRTQPAGATITDAGLIDHAQAPIRFSTLFRRREQRSGGTTQRTIGLASKVSTRVATVFPGLTGHCRAYPCAGAAVAATTGAPPQGGGKLGGPHRLRRKLMAQFQP